MTHSGWPGTPFPIETPEAILDDLHDRLQRARFPAQDSASGWVAGTPVEYMRRLRDFWLNEFDWRSWEQRFNEFDNRMVEVDGHRVHVIVEQGSGPSPMPLLLTNGWPGSFTEFLDLIDRLAHPENHGGRAEDAFTVVVPSLPGYGYSPPAVRSLSPSDIAGLWSCLMIRVFGFERYVAYGSDWGSLITARMAFDFPDKLAAILITTGGGSAVMDENSPPLSADEVGWQHSTYARLMPESAYQMVQATKPQSLSFGQTDSPIGLAAWIVEKFQGWTAQGTHDDPPFPMNDLLANIMLYWINGCVAPMWLYSHLSTATKLVRGPAAVPAGFLFGPDDMMPPAPRSYLERSYKVAHYQVLDHGGHFPGLEVPDELVDAISGFLGTFR
ncbi:epoxide hydrolase family protein [Rhizorhabdus argentea]|uniref:epoxide hydrolase family protein n=1 Tax=Rhizorhabdus argentea TaxID=1387174 RepID=UPI0030EDF4F8